MFANFTVETCTGTGDTLALAGAVAGRIPFSASFADGDLVAYVVEDSGGTIKVAGVGTYVSATDDITRNDTWNWNGTAPDEEPTTNITLSGGTHTVRCDVVADDLKSSGVISGSYYISSHLNELSAVMSGISTTDRIYYFPYTLDFDGSFDAFVFEITTTGTGNLKFGLYTLKDGLPDELLAVADTNTSTGSSGTTEVSFDGGAINIRKGQYVIGMQNDDSVTIRAANADSVLVTPFGGDDVSTVISFKFKSRTFANMPDPADITSLADTDANPATIGLVAT